MAQSLLASISGLFGSTQLSDCEIVFYDKADGTTGGSDGSQPAADVGIGRGPKVLHNLPAHLLAVWSGSALFKAQYERWPAQSSASTQPAAAVGTGAAADTEASGASTSAPHQQRPQEPALQAPKPQPQPQPLRLQLRVVLDAASDLPYALAALRYLYTARLDHVGTVTSDGCCSAAELLHVRRLAGYLQIPECVAACEQALLDRLEAAAAGAGAGDGKEAAAAATAGAVAAAAGAVGAARAGRAAASAPVPQSPPTALPAAVVDTYLAARALLEQEPEEEEEEVKDPEYLGSGSELDFSEDEEEEGEGLDEGVVIKDGWVGHGGQGGTGGAGDPASAALLVRLRRACVRQLVAWAQAHERELQAFNSAADKRWQEEELERKRARKEKRKERNSAKKRRREPELPGNAQAVDEPRSKRQQLEAQSAGESSGGSAGAILASSGKGAAQAQPPQPPQPPSPSFGELLAWAVRSAPHALSDCEDDDSTWSHMADLPAAGLEALLAAESFATDDEASVLLLLAEWVAADSPNRLEDKADLQRLFSLVRLCHMNDVYRTAVLPELAAAWLPELELGGVCGVLKQWSGANALRRYRLRQNVQPGSAATQSRWFVSQPRPVAPRLDVAWSIDGSDLAARWDQANGKFTALSMNLICYAGAAWQVCARADADQKRRAAGLFMCASLPASVLAGRSRREFPGLMVSPGLALLRLHGRAGSVHDSSGGGGGGGSKTTYQVVFRPDRDLVDVAGGCWGYLFAYPVARPALQQELQAQQLQRAGGPPPAVAPWSLHLHEDGNLHGRLRVSFRQRT